MDDSKKYCAKISLSNGGINQLTFSSPVSSIDLSGDEVFKSGNVCVFKDAFAKHLWEENKKNISHQIEIVNIWPNDSNIIDEIILSKGRCDFNGCKAEFCQKDLANHRKVCPHRNVSCTRPHCKKLVAFRNLIQHLTDEHEENLETYRDYFQGHFKIIQSNLSKSVNWKHSRIEFEDKTFLTCFTRIHEAAVWYYWVYLLGSEAEAEQFTFEIK